MEFWRIFRLVYSGRTLILTVVLVAIAAILAGTELKARSAEVTSEATLSIQEPPPVVGVAGEPMVAAPDPNKRISQIFQSLNGNMGIYLEAAELLKMDETRRKEEVLFTLERNNFFAVRDAEVAERIDRDAPDAPDRERRIAEGRKAVRDVSSETLAWARDARGAYAGPEGTTSAIADDIRDHLQFETVEAITSVDGNRQFDPLIKVRGTFEREARANLYVNMVCIAFMKDYARQARTASAIRIAQLSTQRDQLQGDLNTAYRKLSRFRGMGRVQAVVGPNDTLVSKLQVYETERDRAQREYEAVTQQASSFRSALARTPRLITATLPSSQNPAVIRAQERYEEARARFERIRKGNLGPGDDEYRAAETDLKAAVTSLDDARGREFTQSHLNGEYADLESKLRIAEAARSAAGSTLNRYNQQIVELTRQLRQLPGAQAELANVERQIKVLESKIAQTEQQLTSASTDATSRTGTIALSANAHKLAPKPESRAKLLIYGTILALVVAIAFVVARDALDNRIQSSHDVEELLGLPVAGVIPHQLTDPRRAALVAFLDPLSAVAESYRLLRTDLLFTCAEHPFQSLLLTACTPSQGATTTTCNLAIALAQSGKRVILVDADLRRPKLHDLFRISNDRGLTTVLTGQCAVEDGLQRTEIDNLLVLPTGPLPLNPAELLGSTQLRALHDELKRHTDFLLFDTPAAIAFADADLVASVVDATLMVVRAGSVPRDAETRVRARLVKARANLLGVVLNGADPDLVDAVYYQTHHYAELPAATSVPSAPSLPAPAPTPRPVEAPVPPERPAPHVDEGASPHAGPPTPASALPLAPRRRPTPAPPEPVAPEPEGTEGSAAPDSGGPEEEPLSVRESIRRRMERLGLGK